MVTMEEVKAYSTASSEKDTYELKKREYKEKISKEDVKKHWEIRAKRPDVQSVMSARHTLEENKKATIELQNDILDFLNGYIGNKRIFELGFGIGRMTSKLAEMGKEIVACDISQIMFNKAKENLNKFNNIKLHLNKIIELDYPQKSFNLVFDSIVLLHILDPGELKNTIKKMQDFSDTIFICEHTYEGPDFPISKYSILRKPEEYEELFKPYKLVKQKTHFCVGDTFTLMLFQKQ